MGKVYHMSQQIYSDLLLDACLNQVTLFSLWNFRSEWLYECGQQKKQTNLDLFPHHMRATFICSLKQDQNTFYVV